MFYDREHVDYICSNCKNGYLEAKSKVHYQYNFLIILDHVPSISLNF